jgi:hypothetical protein
MAAMLVCGRESFVVDVGVEGMRGAWGGRSMAGFFGGGGGGCALDVSYYKPEILFLSEKCCFRSKIFR